MKVDRVVLDTNVLISALLSSRGAPPKVLDWVRWKAVVVFSDETFTELVTRLNPELVLKAIDNRTASSGLIPAWPLRVALSVLRQTPRALAAR